MTTVFFSCKKDDPPAPPVAMGKYTNGLVVLNEGLYQQNNASLSFYDLEDKQTLTQVFFAENSRGLGDTGNDMVLFDAGGTEYMLVVVDISSQIEILEAKTLKSVKQIPIFNGANGREPRRVDVYENTAFVCNFDGTVSVIDLIERTIIKTIDVGANPDGITKVGSLLFVSNSGGLNFPVYDSTMTVIDMTTHEVVNTFETRMNSTAMIVDAQQEIYLLSNGNYDDVPPAIVRINSSTQQVVDEYNVNTNCMTLVADWIYYYDASLKKVRRFNTITESFENIDVIDAAAYSTFHAIQYVPELSTIFCFDANGYVNSSSVRAYTTSGEFLYEFSAELNAKKLVYND